MVDKKRPWYLNIPMASLRSMILDGRTGIACRPDDAESPELFRDEENRAHHDRKNLQSRETILVSAQGVYESVRDLVNTDYVDLLLIPYPKPPFARMWLECIQNNGVRIGAMVNRDEFRPNASRESFAEYIQRTSGECDLLSCFKKDSPSGIVIADCWQEHQGHAVLMGHILYWLDAEGNLQRCYRHHAPQRSPEKDREFEDALFAQNAWILHAFARMNCHNVALVPATAGATKPKKGKHPPSSVWHEIVVKNLQQLRSEQQGQVAPDGEKREVRFHKVRGHYADYRKGNGLFGKWKVFLYIEEHTAGNPELGTVIGSYKV